MSEVRERLTDGEIDQLINDYMPKDGLDRLRHVFLSLTDEEWWAFVRQLFPLGTTPASVRTRSELIAWLKTWMHRL